MGNDLTLTPVRQRVTWTYWDADALRYRTSHPYVWMVVDHDGDERSFDTKAEALAWMAGETELGRTAP